LKDENKTKKSWNQIFTAYNPTLYNGSIAVHINCNKTLNFSEKIRKKEAK